MLAHIICSSFFFFFNDTATTEIYTLSLHDALPICPRPGGAWRRGHRQRQDPGRLGRHAAPPDDRGLRARHRHGVRPGLRRPPGTPQPGAGRGHLRGRAPPRRRRAVTSPREDAPGEALSTRDRVVDHVRRLLEKGDLRPGDRLPSERDFALELGLSRPSVRSGLEALEAMGVVVLRRGAGTFIADGPASLGSEPLSLLASLHGFTPNEMFEARLGLEVGVAALAAERATAEELGTLAEEVTEMFASVEDPNAFLVHDVRFHRAVAAGCGNRVLAALME